MIEATWVPWPLQSVAAIVALSDNATPRSRAPMTSIDTPCQVRHLDATVWLRAGFGHVECHRPKQQSDDCHPEMGTSSQTKPATMTHRPFGAEAEGFRHHARSDRNGLIGHGNAVVFDQ